jgi:parallel beta-helix repeat protein
MMIRKWLAIGIILLFVGTCIIPATKLDAEKPLSASRGNWLYVDGSGPGNYTKIQDAIDNASDGDVVFVFDDSSPYYENVKVNKSITLLGENRDTVIIDANDNGCPVDLEANNVTVCGFTLQNSGTVKYNDAGIHFKNFGDVPDSNNNTIIGNKIINNYEGIFGIYSKNNIIRDNIIISNHHSGIYFQAGCESNIIQNNTIMENKYGLFIHESSYVQVIENTIENNNEIGVRLFGGANFISIKNNYIANSPCGIILDAGAYSAYGNNIASNLITSNNIGLSLVRAHKSMIHKNNFIKNNISATFFYDSFNNMNKFYRNYWDEHLLTTPKIIQGKMHFFTLLYLFVSLFMPIEPKIIEWKNYDWFPAQEPYDIPVMT